MRKHRSLAGLATAVMVITTLSSQLALPSTAVDATGSYDMNISVDLAGEKKEISPYIYGINEYGDTKSLKTVKAGSIRQGGNRYTGYNWENNYSNAGSDWIYSSDTNLGDDTDGYGYAARRLSESAVKYEIPYKITTLQMAGYVAADKNGTVSEEEAAPSPRWDKVVFRKDGEFSLTPDLTDGTVYMDEYVNYLVQTLGDSTTDTGIQGYHLDNEPALWHWTHSRLHSDGIGSKELIQNSVELAKAVKDVDPNAEIFGPSF